MARVKHLTDVYGNVKTFSYNTNDGALGVSDTKGRTETIWYDKDIFPIRAKDAEGKETFTEYYLYDSINRYGEIKTHIDRYGNATSYERDSVGNITKIINPDKTFREYSYNDMNMPLSEKDETGRMTFYEYAADKVTLNKIAKPLNGTDVYSSSAVQSNFAITKYVYYTDIQAQSQTGHTVGGLLNTETDPENGVITYTYDQRANVATVKNQRNITVNYTNNILGWKKTETNSKGTTTFFYDKTGNILKVVYPSASGGGTERMLYDFRGNLTNKVEANQYASGSDTLTVSAENIVSGTNTYSNSAHGYRYVYNTKGQLQSLTDPLNYITGYAYDDLYGNVTKETRPNNSVRYFTYDANSFSTVFTYDDGGNKLTSVRAGVTRSYTWDKLGNMLSETDGNGSTTYYTYNAFNQIRTVIYPAVEYPGAVFASTGEDPDEYSEITYTVNYDANYGSGAPTFQTKAHDIPIILSSTVPTRSGYTFLGWSLDIAAASVTYQVGDNYCANVSVVLYAVWSAHAATYTINYDANGGSGASASQTKTHGVPLTLSGAIPTRSNYTFLGWSLGSAATSATYQAGGSFALNATVTLYAVWKPDTLYSFITEYKYYYDLKLAFATEDYENVMLLNGTMIIVFFNGDGGHESDELYLSLQAGSQNYGDFPVYHDDGSVVQYLDYNSIVTMEYEDGAFYISEIYDEYPTYVVTYDANGGSEEPSPQTKDCNVPLRLNYNIPIRSGYTFLGWSENNTATLPTYQPGDSYTTNAQATLYAVWLVNPATYTVTFDANGGSGAPAPQIKTHGAPLTLSSAIPIMSGYIFLGWSDSSSAVSPTYQPGGSYSTDAAVSLYAVWEEDPTIVYNFEIEFDKPYVEYKTASAPSYYDDFFLTDGMKLEVLFKNGSYAEQLWLALENGNDFIDFYPVYFGVFDYVFDPANVLCLTYEDEGYYVTDIYSTWGRGFNNTSSQDAKGAVNPAMNGDIGVYQVTNPERIGQNPSAVTFRVSGAQLTVLGDGGATKSIINRKAAVLDQGSWYYRTNVAELETIVLGKHNNFEHTNRNEDENEPILRSGGVYSPGYTVNYYYTTLSELARKADSMNKVNIYSYDFLGNVIAETEKRSNNSEAITRYYEYDLVGNKTKFTDENGKETTYTYDSLNRTISSSITVTDINNVQTVHLTTLIYDANSNLLTEQDWRGNTYSYTYDRINRLIEKRDPNNILIETLAYDDGNLQTSSKDALNNVKYFYYDLKGRIIKENRELYVP